MYKELEPNAVGKIFIYALRYKNTGTHAHKVLYMDKQLASFFSAASYLAHTNAACQHKKWACPIKVSMAQNFRMLRVHFSPHRSSLRDVLDPPLQMQTQYTQDTKTFPKCYVGRNGKRNQQKLHIQVCGSLKTQRNQGCHD